MAKRGDQFVDVRTGEVLDPERARAVLRLSGPIAEISRELGRLEDRRKEIAAEIKLRKARLQKALLLQNAARSGIWQQTMFDEVTAIEKGEDPDPDPDAGEE
jgi:hypothetical protein